MMYLFDKLLFLSLIIFPITLLGFGLAMMGSGFSGGFRGGVIRNSEDIEALKDFFKSRIVKTLFLSMAFSGIILFGGMTAFSEILESKTKSDLKGFQNKSDKLFINGKLAESPVKIINEITNYCPIPSNHSVPTKSLKIKALINNREIHLSLARDNKDSTVYWVSVPGYIVTKDNAIWKVRTNLFNTYK